MRRRQPRSTRTDTLCPYTTLVRSWLDRASRTTSVTPTHLIRTWSIVDPRRKTLDGVAITISGLDRSITDVLVRIVPIQGNARTQFMTSQTPRLVLSSEGADRKSVV